ncbi:MAG TPA: Zn-dependent alcohol dehydrogenase [Jatrophihabitans sp.]|jgi:S-(hydroxymethyl)glutathione dehydrogenase/alcohol dehydrogenase
MNQLIRAVIAPAPGDPLVLADVELPELTEEQVRVRIRAAGVCHSDLSMINGTVTPQFPLILGHEASGVVTEIGPSVTNLAVGDHVVLNWAPPCRACWYCTHGQPWLCETAAGVASRPLGHLADGTATHVTLGIGALAEEVVVAARAAIRLPKELPLAEAALLGCAVLTGIGAVQHTARVGAGDSVAVIGLGGVGLSAIVGARLAGARTIAVDAQSDKEKLARSLGATDFLLSSPTLAREVRALTEGRGVDHAFECVGRSNTIRDAWQCTRRGGNTVVVGMGSKDDLVTLSALEIFHFSRTLVSSVYGSTDPDVDVPLLAAAALDGRLDLAALVTHRVGPDDVDAAFDRMRRGTGARSLVLFG